MRKNSFQDQDAVIQKDKLPKWLKLSEMVLHREGTETAKMR